MKTWKRRLIAVLCCVVLFATSLYVAQPQEAEAAESSGTMTITTKEQGYKLVADGGTGEVNFDYATTVENYSSYGTNFLDATFISNYITFGGGMTAADLLDGLTTFYVANATVLQFKWASRTTAFTEGWSFTIAQGALLPYTNTNSATAYMALDKEYTFTFIDGSSYDAGYTNVLKVTSVKTTTFSLGNLTLWGNGTGDLSTQFYFTDTNVSAEDYQYQVMQTDETYADYVTISGVDFEDYATKGIQLQYIVSADAKCIQMFNWGTLRDSMVAGDQIIFREGLPIYYTGADGNSWRATLDATYVYECQGSNSENTQIFYGVKFDDSVLEYGLNITASQATALQGTSEQYMNVGFDYATVVAGEVQQHSCSVDILADTIAEEYLQIADFTVEEASALGIVMRYIPNASVIQMGFQPAAVAALEVGDTIVLKEGMPVVYLYSGTLYAAKLDAEYTFTLLENNGTNLTWSRTLTGSYSLEGTISGPAGPENSYYYYGITITPDAFADIQTRTEGLLDVSTWQSYVLLSQHTMDDLNEDATYMRWYGLNATVFQGLRLYSNLDFVDGEMLIIKKGFPLSYNTSVTNYSDGSGVKTKTIYLDKDYGFVYSSSTGKFTYDASLTAESLEEKFDFTSSSVPSDLYDTEEYRTNVAYISTKTAATAEATGNILDSKGEAGNTADYVNFCGMDSDTLTALGVKIIFYPNVTTFQIVWGADALSWVEVGNTITFTEGMPVYYATGDVMYLSETTVYTVSEVTDTGFTITRYAESGEYLFSQDVFGTGTDQTSEGQQPVYILNGALDDAKENTYEWLAEDAVAQYIDFCGLTADELSECGTRFKVVRVGETQILQIFFGTVTDKMAINDQIIFYKGLPITYTTTDGLTKNIYLSETMIFTVTEGNDSNTYVLKYTESDSFGLWAIDAVSSNTVAGSADGTEGFYNNIGLYTSDFTKEITAVRYTLTPDQLKKYVSFVHDPENDPENLSAEAYGYSAIVIIDGDTKVVQLRWGDVTSAVEDGDEIVFKKGLSIQATTADGATKIYTLNADYTFTIQTYATGANEFRLVGMQVSETSTTAGDVDGDYLLDKNDISLLKKQLVGIINVSDAHFANANADESVNSADLVYALKTWNKDEQEEYTTLYENVASTTIAAGATYTVTLNQDLGTVNYLRLTFDTTQNIYGTFSYTYNGTEYSENFYLAEDEVQFEQFLDNYRVNGVLGTTDATSKTLTSISFKNVGSSEATFLLNKVEMAARTFENGKMLCIENDNIKIGVDLNMGGSLAYYESLKYNPVEYRDSWMNGYNVHIGVGESGYDEVNLINIYDLGRQVQQSFYIDLSADDGYTNGTYAESTWPYNPVQAGDQNNNMSQIIDYRKIDTDGDESEDIIYVKTRAMDWSNPGSVSGGTTTQSYMENWYKLSDNLLYVDNAFVDWAGWQYVSVNPSSQELPAFYTGQALNYFVAGNDTSTRYANQGSWSDGDSTNNFQVSGDSTSDWYAWVNADDDNAFGFGILIPNVDACTAGRSTASNSYYKTANRGASDAPILELCGDYLTCKYDYQNCYVVNTSYIAPGKSTTLAQYTSYEYTYVLTADNLTNMEQAFKSLAVDEDGDGEVDMNTAMRGW